MNYQKELEKYLTRLPDRKQHLLLHSCCAPCSSYVLEYLREYFLITVFYYNPNISSKEEYHKRAAEQLRLIEQMPFHVNPIEFIEGAYEPERFYQEIRGLEVCREGGERCRKCYELRLKETAGYALRMGFDYFTTTLTISPLKKADWLNEIGIKVIEQIESTGEIENRKLQFLPSDFKKKNGYKRSIELSKEYDLYRQDYCGCIFSKRQGEIENQSKS